MKTATILLFTVLLSAKISFSQDTLLMRNNTIILAKVLEVLPTEVKYKRLEMMDGPVFYETKKYIKVIKYQNGFKEEFQTEDIIEYNKLNSVYRAPVNYKIQQSGRYYIYMGNRLNERGFNKLMLESNDKEIITLILKSKRAKKVNKIGFVAIPFLAAGAGALLLSSFIGEGSLKFAGGCILIAAPIGITSLTNIHKYRTYKHDALLLHNLKY